MQIPVLPVLELAGVKREARGSKVKDRLGSS